MTWPCEAYGPVPAEVGAVCFIAGQPHERVCGSPGECAAVMAAERQRVFRRMHELAASGDPVWAQLSGEFTHPDQLLGGPGPDDAGDD